MATLNVARLRVKVAQDPNGKLKAVATQRANVLFEDSVVKLQAEFEESEVTQEIDGGIGASNISDTLRGGAAPENLYSFIGFPNGEDGLPTDAIRKRLDPAHPDGPKIKLEAKDTQRGIWRFRVIAPGGADREKLWKATPLPWAKGLSWAQKIETGIMGFAHFLARFTKSKASRSGGGVQVAPTVRAASYTPPAKGYINTFINRFIERIKDADKTGRNRGAGGRFTPFQ